MNLMLSARTLDLTYKDITAVLDRIRVAGAGISVRKLEESMGDTSMPF